MGKMETTLTLSVAFVLMIGTPAFTQALHPAKSKERC